MLTVLKVLHNSRVKRVGGYIRSCTHAAHTEAVTFSVLSNAILVVLLLLHRHLSLLDGLKMLLSVHNSEGLCSCVVN